MVTSAAPGQTSGRRRVARYWPTGTIVLLALGSRLAVLPGSHEGNMSADAAHFLNVARCVGRGQGFSNPAAWPAWLRPERLPAPETFKDPGLPFAIAALTPLVRDPFRAGQILSLLAGVLLPLAVYALGRKVAHDRALAWVAALIAAGSPILIAQSVRVMAESLFTLLLTLAFVAAASGTDEADEDPARPGRALRAWGPPRDVSAWAAGALLGLAFLVRAQALLAIPALAVLATAGTTARAGIARVARALVAMTVTASPLLLRNLVTFGSPLHSDATTFAVWPFVDPLEFSHALTRPPGPFPFALAHAPQVLAHTASQLARFARSALPGEILGTLAWAPALAAGLGLGIVRFRTWAFAWAYLVPVVLLMSAVSWNTRYFASTAPLWCLLTALGAVWLARRLPAVRWPVAARAVAVAAVLAYVGLQSRRVARDVRGYTPPEIAAAIAESPVIASRLAPGESLMAVTTSYWSWFSDRTSVHLVIADEPEFMAVVRRYRVRWAALPTSRLAEFAARYPGGRLPAALVPDHADPERDVTVFVVRETR
jgi:4-amino-4-deoxy-L-arabinose transferase-like glycosyltransferase